MEGYERCNEIRELTVSQDQVKSNCGESSMSPEILQVNLER